MRKLTILLSLLLLANFAAAQQTAELSKSATFTIPPLYYADENINFTTATATDLTCYLVSAASSTVVTLSGTGFEATGEAYNVMIPANLLSATGTYQFNYDNADCIKGWVYLDVIPSLVYNDKYGTADRIADVSAMVIASSYSGLSQAAKDLIIAGNDIIPASGMTLPKFNYFIDGDASRVLIARGLSYSANEPDVLFRLVDGSGTEVTHAMEDSFTWASFAMQAPDITGATPYAHLFKWQITDSVPDGWFQMYTVVESNSRAIGTVNTIILSPTATIDESGLVSQTAFNDFVSDVSQSFRSIRQGHPAEFTAYRNSAELTRATPSVSSLSSRHAAAGSLYGLRSRFFDPFNDEYVTTDWLYDYDETYGASGRGKAFEATINSVSETAVLEDVTLTTSGEIE